jgi:hypothetical protein
VITSRKFQGSDTCGFTNWQRIAFASTRKRKKGGEIVAWVTREEA